MIQRGRLFIGFASPAVIWLVFTCWARLNYDTWVASPDELSWPIRLAIAADNWAIRMLPVVVMVVVLLSPLVTLALVALSGCLRLEAPEPARAFHWWTCCLSSLVLGAAFAGLTGLISPPRARTLAIPVDLVFLWAALLCYSFALGEAYALQRLQASGGHSRMSAMRVLLAALACQVLCPAFAMLVPLAVWWSVRRDQAAAL